MNSKGNQESTVILSFPYNYADPRAGFGYDGPRLTSEEYSRKMVAAYNHYKEGVDDVLRNYSYRVGTNIAINDYEKENNRYRQQDCYYEDTRVNIYDGSRCDMTIDTLIGYFKSGEPFVLVVNMYKLGDERYADLLSDVKTWADECRKVTGCNDMSSGEKLTALSKKSMKLKFEDARSSAILHNCKMIEVVNNRTFTFLVERITFVTEQ